jgi:hypothetical protein
MISNTNQRQFPRRAAFIIAEYTTDEGTFRDVIKNIGANGLFVRTWRKFVAEESIVLKFPLFSLDQIIQVSGKIVRNDRDGFAVAFDTPIQGLICKAGHLPEIVHAGEREN